MDRHFALPVLFAAALHGGLFFGFPQKPAPTPPRPSPVEGPVITVVPPPEKEEVVIVLSDEPMPKGNPNPPPIARDQPLIADMRDFVQKVPDLPPIEAPLMNRIPDGPIGVPGGAPEVPRDGRIVSSVFLDNPPRARVQAPLPYPHEAKREGLTGSVTVEFTVDETGRVIDPRIIDSTNHLFDAPTLQGVLKWRFEPGRRGGRVVRFRMAQPVHFSLNN